MARERIGRKSRDSRWLALAFRDSQQTRRTVRPFDRLLTSQMGRTCESPEQLLVRETEGPSYFLFSKAIFQFSRVKMGDEEGEENGIGKWMKFSLAREFGAPSWESFELR